MRSPASWVNLKQTYNIASATWRAALAELEAADAALKPAPAIASSEPAAPAPKPQTTRDYLTPEEAADALGIHVQTLRGYVRSGKLPAKRLAGMSAPFAFAVKIYPRFWSPSNHKPDRKLRRTTCPFS